MRLFLGLMLITFNIFAAEWKELEVHRNYKLTQGFQLQQIERSRSILELLRGEKFILTQVTGLEMINVTLFTFDYLKCPGPNLKTEMEIIPVRGTIPLVEIGAQVQSGCKLEIFIENKDLNTNSFFE